MGVARWMLRLRTRSEQTTSPSIARRARVKATRPLSRYAGGAVLLVADTLPRPSSQARKPPTNKAEGAAKEEDLVA